MPSTAQDHGKKKKRGYATQAYEFGAGGNAAASVASPAQPYGANLQAQQSQTPGFGTQYPGQDAQHQPSVPAYGGVAPQYDASQPGAAAVPPQAYGYQAPDAGGAYPVAGNSAGAPGLNHQMASMNLGGQPQTPQAQGAVRPVALNQLYPTDLLNQPFNVSELDLPPPPILLPPNVRRALANCRCINKHCDRY